MSIDRRLTALENVHIDDSRITSIVYCPVDRDIEYASPPADEMDALVAEFRLKRRASGGIKPDAPSIGDIAFLHWDGETLRLANG